MEPLIDENFFRRGFYWQKQGQFKLVTVSTSDSCGLGAGQSKLVRSSDEAAKSNAPVSPLKVPAAEEKKNSGNAGPLLQLPNFGRIFKLTWLRPTNQKQQQTIGAVRVAPRGARGKEEEGGSGDAAGCFIEFSTAETAQKALALNGALVPDSGASLS
ncbi:hypothetical protein N0V88_008207 [Collariella sp. IMI 366227]|nr:hypothetical protein N0V88_008207 [Collariella sp. IMI 366227]